MGKLVSDNFTRFTTPKHTGVSDGLFNGVKTYAEEVLNSVSDMSAEHLEEVRKLVNLMQPHLQTEEGLLQHQ